MSNLMSIIIVAIFGVAGNIAYFEYRTKKESSRDLLKQRLTNLLLPLYIVLHVDEASTEAWLRSGEGEYEDIYSSLPTRVLSPVEKIIKDNIYLADDKLHEACLSFLQWAYGSDTNQRFQDLMNRDFDFAIQDKDFKKFYDIVVSEYNNTRRAYLNK